MGFSIWFKRRPDINEQNTGHEAFQRPMGLARAGYAGMAGIRTGSLSPIYPGTFDPNINLVKSNPFVTGNPNTNVKLEPLSDPDDAVSRMRAYAGGI